MKVVQDALGNRTYTSYDVLGRPVNTILPNDTTEGQGTVSSASQTTVTDTGKSWYPDQMAGMMLQIADVGFFLVVSNTENSLTVASGNVSGAAGKQYWLKPTTETNYSACCDRVTSERDERRQYTYYEYDDGEAGGPGRLTGVRNSVTGSGSANPLVDYSYNDLGQTTEVRTYKDASDNTGRVTATTYDQLDRVTKITHPGSGLLYDEYYQYDVAGDLVAKLQGFVSGDSITSGEVTVYEYDALGRLTKVKNDYTASVWPLTSITISSPDVSYQYDGGSSLKSQMVDASGTSSYTYDLRGRLETYAPPIPSGYSVTYAYNNADDKTQVLVKLNNADKYKTDYSYFKNGWLKLVTASEYDSGWQEKARVGFAYDAAGRRTAVNNANGSGVQTAIAYNSRNETRSVVHSGGATLYGLAYARDAGGNPLQITFTGSQVPSPYTNSSAVYGYDQLSRLTSETYPGESNTWSYDWVGNRLEDGSYNAVDQLDAGNGYTYDLKGALTYKPSPTADPRLHYQYGSDDLMQRIDLEGSSAQDQTSMIWDADEQRLKLTEEAGYANWQFLYDTVAGTPAVLVEQPEDVAWDETPTYYVREPSGELLARFESAGSATYYQYDALGSTVVLSDPSGNPTGAYAYDAWGNVLASPAAWQPYQYVGGLGYYTHHAGQGSEIENWLQLGVRFYQPELGRFDAVDPFALPQVAVYCYSNNRPLAMVDPLGLHCYYQPKQSTWYERDWYMYSYSTSIWKTPSISVGIPIWKLPIGVAPWTCGVHQMRRQHFEKGKRRLVTGIESQKWCDNPPSLGPSCPTSGDPNPTTHYFTGETVRIPHTYGAWEDYKLYSVEYFDRLCCTRVNGGKIEQWGCW